MGIGVYVVGKNVHVERMFMYEGADIAEDINTAELIVFTGGSDVSPALYNQTSHRKTVSDPVRDRKEAAIFDFAVKNNKGMLGICRGAQLLNVLCGGTLYQHVNNHGDSHDYFDLEVEELYKVSSTHHQMMMAGKEAKILGIAWKSTEKWGYNSATRTFFRFTPTIETPDIEVVAYPNQKVLCYQPHPEFRNFDKKSLNRFFDMVMEYCVEDE